MVCNQLMQTVMRINIFPVVNSKKTEFAVFEIIAWLTLTAGLFSFSLLSDFQ